MGLASSSPFPRARIIMIYIISNPASFTTGGTATNICCSHNGTAPAWIVVWLPMFVAYKYDQRGGSLPSSHPLALTHSTPWRSSNVDPNLFLQPKRSRRALSHILFLHCFSGLFPLQLSQNIFSYSPYRKTCFPSLALNANSRQVSFRSDMWDKSIWAHTSDCALPDDKTLLIYSCSFKTENLVQLYWFQNFFKLILSVYILFLVFKF